MNWGWFLCTAGTCTAVVMTTVTSSHYGTQQQERSSPFRVWNPQKMPFSYWLNRSRSDPKCLSNVLRHQHVLRCADPGQQHTGVGKLLAATDTKWHKMSRLGCCGKEYFSFSAPALSTGECDRITAMCVTVELLLLVAVSRIIAADIAVCCCRGRRRGELAEPLWAISGANCSGLYVTDREAITAREAEGIVLVMMHSSVARLVTQLFQHIYYFFWSAVDTCAARYRSTYIFIIFLTWAASINRLLLN